MPVAVLHLPALQAPLQSSSDVIPVALLHLPALHAPLQSLSDVIPVALLHLPALHEAHDATFEDNEYKPGAQGVQLVAPVPAPVFVMEPAAHV